MVDHDNLELVIINQDVVGRRGNRFYGKSKGSTLILYRRRGMSEAEINQKLNDIEGSKFVMSVLGKKYNSFFMWFGF